MREGYCSRCVCLISSHFPTTDDCILLVCSSHVATMLLQGGLLCYDIVTVIVLYTPLRTRVAILLQNPDLKTEVVVTPPLLHLLIILLNNRYLNFAYVQSCHACVDTCTPPSKLGPMLA